MIKDEAKKGTQKVYFGLPEEVKFCKKCVMSNQKPNSVPEFKNTAGQKKLTIAFDEAGVCDACRYAEMKEMQIDWKKREEELVKLLDSHRRKDGYYDILVPGSGGKDSVQAAHLLKYKYGMNPLTITWPPHMYTDVGYRNFRRWIDIGGFDNITFNPNGKVHRLLTKLAVENLFHPFQPFIIGQKNLAPKIAMKFGIKLIFYGDCSAEYGNPIAENFKPNQGTEYYTLDKKDFSKIHLGGVSVDKLIKDYGLSLNDLEPYLPLDKKEIIEKGIDFRILGYYIKWSPQEAYRYAVRYTNFETNDVRTEGTFTRYNSLDDQIDGLNYWATHLKFGIGRATYEASHEIRYHLIAREEGVKLVHRFDGEFPKRYFKEILEYMDMKEEKFFELADKFRSPHLWEKINGKWNLKHKVS
ncbi:MAG: N-acetyl sugar amidotransferase [Candidatus Omnitrophica bacterium]|nr:N-acetyl sugar amidotransferase [Candidatus Omnitrophota bacterium]